MGCLKLTYPQNKSLLKIAYSNLKHPLWQCLKDEENPQNLHIAKKEKGEKKRTKCKRYRYTGMERDDETGLSYHNARYYIPWLGRWLNPDPIGIGDGVNVYAYCHDNPVNGTDTSGTQIKSNQTSLLRATGTGNNTINTKALVTEAAAKAEVARADAERTAAFEKRQQDSLEANTDQVGSQSRQSIVFAKYKGALESRNLFEATQAQKAMYHELNGENKFVDFYLGSQNVAQLGLPKYAKQGAGKPGQYVLRPTNFGAPTEPSGNITASPKPQFANAATPYAKAKPITDPDVAGGVKFSAGMSAEAAAKVTSNISRVDHASIHLKTAGLISGNLGSKEARQSFQKLAQEILTNPLKTFDYEMSRGGQQVKGYLSIVNGQNVVITVAKGKEGKIEPGDIVTSFIPTEQQMKNWGL